MKKAFLLILLFIPLLYGCATQSVTVQEEGDVQLLVEKLKEYNESISTIKAHALLMYTDGDKSYSFRAEIAVENSGENIRLDLSDFVFKKPVLTLVKNSDQVAALLHMDKKVYLTSYENLNIEALSGLKLRKEILLPALMGKVFVNSATATMSSPNSKTLIMESEGYRETVSFDAHWLPQSVEYEVNNDVYSMTFKSFTAFEGVFFPGKVTLSSLNRQLEATFKDVTVNGMIDDGLFLLDEKSLPGYTNEAL